MPQDDSLRWKVASGPEGPYAAITEDYASVWFEMDSYGRVHHVTNDLGEAEKKLQAIQQRFRAALHAKELRFRDADIYVDGLPGGRNRMIVSFHFSPYGGTWDDATQDVVTTALGNVKDYRPIPKTAALKMGLEHNPDLLSYKAFLSEFKQGIAAGAEEAASATSGSDPVGYQGRLTMVDDLVTSATQDLLELAKRLVAIASQGRATIAINEHRLVPKMSGILSSFFYNVGKLRGMQHGTGDA